MVERDSGTTDAAVVSDLRRATGRFPEDERLTELIRVLRAGNRRFAELWAAGAVAAHREDHESVEHPSVGPVAVDCDVLTDGDSGLKIVIMTAVPGSEDETKLRFALIADPAAAMVDTHLVAGAAAPRAARPPTKITTFTAVPPEIRGHGRR